MQDIDTIYMEWNAAKWDRWLEEGRIIEISRLAKRVGFTCKVVVTSGLFGELQPFAEEAIKGHSLEERVGELLTQFKKAKDFATEDYVEFNLKLRHMVKNDSDFLNPDTFKDNADKSLVIVAGKLADDNSDPALVFAMKPNIKTQPPAA